ncbi:MAG: hypothetical protein RRY79_00765 [Clostridia bacterium]
MKDEGLVLPEDYATHIDMAENFVYKYTPMIIEGKIDTSINLFSYAQSNEMLNNLNTILYDSGLATKKPIYTKRAYTLKNSTPIGLWYDSYLDYNCYAYSLGKISGLQPGSLSGDSLNSWTHKPGGTQPLKWNYSSPNSAIWSNEATAYGYTYEPTITYESTTYYIIYKRIGDPGIQPWSLLE